MAQENKFCTKCGNNIEKIKRHSFCPACGGKDEGRKFCPECGCVLHVHPKDEAFPEQLREEIVNEVPPVKSSKFCPKCQKTLSDEYSFCNTCGVPLITEPATTQQQMQSPMNYPQPPQHSGGLLQFGGKVYGAIKSLMPDWGKLKHSMEAAAEEEEKTGRQGQAGKDAEKQVQEVFKAKHYKIIRTDWNTQYGEVDIIVARGSSSKMIECKFRKAPLGIGDYRSYMELFRFLKKQSIDGTHVNSMIIIAPIGGVSQQVRNEVMTTQGTIDVWEMERFKQECERLED